MSITLLNQQQIKDFTSPTGVWNATGWLISGGFNVSGTISGTSGYFSNLSVQNIDVNGTIRSPYLSGIVGTAVTGSGIVEFLPIYNSSGLNEHFYLNIHDSGNTFQQKFSSQDSQEGWFYFSNTASTWQSFPAIGLDSSLQQTSLVRKIYATTGMNVFNKYFSDLSIIYAGNITGSIINSVQFQTPTQGFTVVHIPTLTQYFETADSRYARKAAVGTDFILSGVKISGSPIMLPTFPAIPSSNHGTGTIIQVSGQLWNYHERVGFSGYQRVSNYTGISVASGGVLTGPHILFSGVGGTLVSQSGNHILISGAGGGGAGTVTGFSAFSGGQIIADSFPAGVLIVSGARNSPVKITQEPDGGFYYMEVSDGTYIKRSTNTRPTLYYGPVVFSGAHGLVFETLENQSFTYTDSVTASLDGGFGTLLRMVAVGQVTGFRVNNGAVFTGVPVFSGAGDVTVSMSNLGGNFSGIVISGASAGGSSSIGGVTGFALSSTTVFNTGSFYISGSGGTTVTMVSGAPNVSGFIVSSSSTSLTQDENDQIMLQIWNTAGY